MTSTSELAEPRVTPYPGPSRRAVLRSVGNTALARLVAMVVSAGLGVVATRLIIEHYGAAAYGQYMLLVGIAALLPFADLGISAAIVNVTASADDPRRDDHLRLTLVTCYRILACCAAVVILVALTLTVAGAWPRILGDGLLPGSGARAAGLCLGVFGVNLLVSGGERILNGLGRYHIAVAMRVVQTPVVLVILVIAILLDVNIGGYVAVASYVGTFVATALALLLANRWLRPTIRTAFVQAWQLRRVRGAKVFDTAWPMLVQMIALPLAMQSDRVVLSHVAAADQLYEYSLATQMFGPAIAVVTAAGMSLWPVFAGARAKGVESSVSPHRMSLLFAGLGLVVSIAVCAASGPLSQVASGGRITLELPLLLAFSAFVLVQTAKGPLGMYLTDSGGLRFQAAMVVCMLPVNLGLSIVLARAWGASGPVLGSVASVAFFQVVANWWYAARRQRRRAMAKGTGR